MNRRLPAMLMLTSLAACSTSVATGPSLAPRPGEAIDPRVPVQSKVIPGLVSPAIASRLAQLVNQAQDGDAAFLKAAGIAERLAAAAGPAQSESWVAAQQALSAAHAAREPTTRALGDIDALAANSIVARGGLSPADLAAIQSAAAEVGAIDRRQAATIDALQARLGT